MGSPSGGVGSGGGIGGGSENGGAREAAESKASSQAGMTGSERTQDAEAKSDKSFSESLAEAKAENDRSSSPNDDGGQSTTAAGGGTPGTPGTPETPDGAAENDDRGVLDRAGDFFGGLAKDMQDFARENPRVDSYGNTVGLVDADGIQRGEVASRVMSSGTNSEDLANQLGFSSPQDMAAAQNTDFIDDKLQEQKTAELAAALEERYGKHPDLPSLLQTAGLMTPFAPEDVGNPNAIEEMNAYAASAAVVPASMPATGPIQKTAAYDAAVAMANAEFGVGMEVMRQDLNRDIDKAVAGYDREIAAIDERLAEIDAQLNPTSANRPTSIGTLGSIPPERARALIDEGRTLTEQRTAFEKKRSRAEQARSYPDQLDMMHIARDVYGDETALANSHISRLSDQELKDLGLEPSLLDDPETGLHAEVYHNAITDQVVLAFEGTDPKSIDDWVSNGAQGVGVLSPQYEQARFVADRFDRAFADEEKAITGHSLGGGLAAYAGLAEGVEATTFNAAGLHAESLERLGVSREEALEIVDAYHVDGEILSWAQDSTAADLVAAGLLGPGYAAYSDFDPVPAAVGERHVYQARNSQDEPPRFGGGALRPGDLAQRVDLHDVQSVLHSIRAELDQAQREIDPI